MGKHPPPLGDWGSFAESKTPSVGSAATSLTEGGKKSCLCTVRVGEAPTRFSYPFTATRGTRLLTRQSAS